MSTVFGTYDSAAKNCVLLYDFSAGSYDGEPTTNLFYQPPGYTQYSGTYYNSATSCGGLNYRTFIHTQEPVSFPPGSQRITGYVEFTRTSGVNNQGSTGYLTLSTSGFSDFYYCDTAQASAGNAKVYYEGFDITPFSYDTGRAFYRLDYYRDLNNQGTFFDNAPGPYLPSDSIYKYNYQSGKYESTLNVGNKHGFNIKIARGETYTVSAEVYVSTGHPRSGLVPVVSLTPNLTGTFATLSGVYDCDKKGTWQSIKQKIFVPSAINAVSPNPTYFEVSVANKTAQHPYFSSGSAYGFVIGNTQGRTLNLYKGGTYVFVQSNDTNINDEFYISTSPNSGGGSNAYSNGFSYYGNKGFDGYAVFNVPYNAPSILYYNSRAQSSSYVGGKINVVGGYNSGNTGNTGSIGSGGSAGSAGSAGSSGTTVTSESYSVCFDPTRGVFNSSQGNLSGGYILYKNMQFERNKKMFKGTTHKTQFTASSRSDAATCIDLTGGDNNSNFINSNYDANAYLYFAKRQNVGDGGFIDINLKYNKEKPFIIGSAKTQSFDFWFKQTGISNSRAFLFSRSSASSNDLFIENQGYPQLIFIQDKRVYFSFTSSVNRSFSGYTQQIIEPNVLYNVIVSLNFNAVVGQKIKIYVNGLEAQTTVLSVLDPPQSLNFKNVTSATQVVGDSAVVSEKGFKSNSNQFYCISSYDSNGESKSSAAISVPASTVKKSIQLSWQAVDGAAGYYIYRSKSSTFGASSLLADVNSGKILSFTDENFPTKTGNPKQVPAYSYFYDENTLNLVDDSTAKVCFGDYPTTNAVPHYFEGYIYRIAIYNTNISDKQASRNYNSLLYKYSSGNPYLSREIFRPRSVIYKKVQN